MEQTLITKLQTKVNDIIDNVEKYGYEKFSTCNHSNWDRDFHNYRYSITDKVRSEGYNVSETTSFGVVDFTITKKIGL